MKQSVMKEIDILVEHVRESEEDQEKEREETKANASEESSEENADTDADETDKFDSDPEEDADEEPEEDADDSEEYYDDADSDDDSDNDSDDDSDDDSDEGDDSDDSDEGDESDDDEDEDIDAEDIDDNDNEGDSENVDESELASVMHQGKTLDQWEHDFNGEFTLQQLKRMAFAGVDLQKMLVTGEIDESMPGTTEYAPNTVGAVMELFRKSDPHDVLMIQLVPGSQPCFITDMSRKLTMRGNYTFMEIAKGDPRNF